jgi:hypothetical protein
MSSSSSSPSQEVKNQNSLGSRSQTQPTQRKGKLRSISKTVKEKAFKQLDAESDVSDFPSARLTPSQETVNKKSGRKSQVKRKSTDDDEFVPEESRAKRRTNTRRKQEPVPCADGKKLRATAHTNKHHSSTASPRHSLIAGLWVQLRALFRHRELRFTHGSDVQRHRQGHEHRLMYAGLFHRHR